MRCPGSSNRRLFRACLQYRCGGRWLLCGGGVGRNEWQVHRRSDLRVDEMNTAEMIAGGLCGLAFVFVLVGNCFALHLGYTKRELLLEHFKNSSPSISNAVRIHKGCWGRLQLVGSACMVLTFPDFFIRYDVLSVQDFEDFPRPLRWKLVVLQWSVIASFTAMALLVALWKSGALI